MVEKFEIFENPGRVFLLWSPSIIISVYPVNYPRWQPLMIMQLLVFQHLISKIANILEAHLY
jgi:hypothetical protein